ncbi:MAG: nuclear transport factor 2 family protein [Dehalococcoidia bacterium]
MSDEGNLAILSAALAAFNDNDIDRLAQHVHDDVKYIIRGRSFISGTYEGREAMAQALRKVKELTDGTMTATPEVMLSGGDAVMAYLHVTGSRPNGRTYDNYQAYLYRFRDGKLAEGQTIPVDQAAFEEFLA